MSSQTIDQQLDEAYALTDRGLLQQALEAFLRISELDVNNAESLMMIGTIHGELGDTKQAFNYLDKAIILDAEYPDCHYMKCKLFQSLGQVPEAIECARQAVQLDSKFGEAWFVLAGIYIQSEQSEEAELCSRKAVEYLPKSIDAKLNLAYLLNLKGDSIQAMKLYREIQMLDPTNAEVTFNIGALLQERGEIAEAEQYYLSAIRLNPSFADAHSALGDVQLTQNKHSDALNSCRKAVELKPKSNEFHNRLELTLTVVGSDEKRQLVARLEQDYIFSDIMEVKTIAQQMAVLFYDEYPEVRDTLINLFVNFNPGEIYASKWWDTQISKFGLADKAQDKIARGVLSILFCWSIPSKETLDAIAEFVGQARLASYGCGRAYWEYLLNEHYGIEIEASDLCLRNRFLEIKQQNYADAEIVAEDVVLISWIPKGESSAESILEKMNSGQKFIIVGEPPEISGGARVCGTNRFFNLLGEQYSHKKTIPLVRFSTHRDTVELYVKN